MTTAVHPPSHSRLPTSSLSYGFTSDSRAPSSSRQPPLATPHLFHPHLNQPLRRNASGPLSTARRERSSKPIMVWLAKKLGASKKVTGNERKDEGKRWKPAAVAIKPANGLNVPPTTRGPGIGTRNSPAPTNPISFPFIAQHHRITDNTDRHTFATRSSVSPDNSIGGSRSPSEISLADSYLGVEDPDDRSFVPSRSETWTGGPDDDASIRPIPPSHSSSPARSAFSSPPSHHRFRGAAASQSGRPGSISTTTSSIRYAPSETPSKGWRSFGSNGGVTAASGGSASTKPTTVFSTESGILPPAHIAEVAPLDAGGGVAPLGMAIESAVGTSSSFPIQPPPRIYRTLTRDSTISSPTTHPSPLGAVPPTLYDGHDLSVRTTTPCGQVPPPLTNPTLHVLGDVQAPKHSYHHPRNNPRPNALPQANASTLTLASSTFAMPSAGMNGAPSQRARSVAESHRFSLLAGEDAARDMTVDEGTNEDMSLENMEVEDVPTTPLAQSSPTTSHFIPGRRSLDLHSAAAAAIHDASSIRDGTGTSNRGPASSYYYGRHRLDDDASVRALRRRGSWESGESKFSWVGLPQPLNGGPSVVHSSGASARSGMEKGSSIRGKPSVEPFGYVVG